MKSTNKLLLGLVSLFTILFAMGLVSSADVNGTITMTLPYGTTVGASFPINITNSSTLESMMNCTFYINSTSSLTANTTVYIGTIVNHSQFNYINLTYDNTTQLEDSIDYNLSCICRNNTADYGTASSVITIDNTIPQAASSPSPSDASTETDRDVTFSATVTGRNTTNCTLYFTGAIPGSGDPNYTMTHSGNTCTYSLTSIPEGTYQWRILSSDGTNETDSSLWSVTVDTQSGGGGSLPVCGDGVCDVLEVEGASMECPQDCTAGGLWTSLSDTTQTVIIVIVLLVILFLIFRRR